MHFLYLDYYCHLLTEWSWVIAYERIWKFCGKFKSSKTSRSVGRVCLELVLDKINEEGNLNLSLTYDPNEWHLNATNEKW